MNLIGWVGMQGRINSGMKKLRFTVSLLLLAGFWSCSNDTTPKKVTLIVTSNVRGQLDPCG